MLSLTISVQDNYFFEKIPHTSYILLKLGDFNKIIKFNLNFRTR